MDWPVEIFFTWLAGISVYGIAAIAFHALLSEQMPYGDAYYEGVAVFLSAFWPVTGPFMGAVWILGHWHSFVTKKLQEYRASQVPKVPKATVKKERKP